ncbi:senescence-specific cysteine protease SAG39-like [Salvia divinorum]|uniref:Senescence-specific cysteine protease SAG39-like n=1 Tax=Salvia divinorum TaxID=28513 RepID=A0ABD1FJZ1_SALDI
MYLRLLLLLYVITLFSSAPILDPECSCPSGAAPTPLVSSGMFVKHKKWMDEHGFSYENEEVKEKRFRIFKDNVHRIER